MNYIGLSCFIVVSATLGAARLHAGDSTTSTVKTTKSGALKKVISTDSILRLDAFDINKPLEIQAPSLSDEFIKREKEAQIDADSLKKILRYPDSARQNSLEGQVVLRVLVDTSGKVLKCMVVKTTSPLFSAEAQRAVMLTPFTPAVQNKKPIKSWVTVPVNFRLW